MFCCNPFKGRRERRREDWGDTWRVKVVVVGDGGCGKTSLVQRHCHGTLPHTYTPTLFDTCTTSSEATGRKVQMVIQDTGGQEDLDRLRPSFYMHSDVIIVCFPANCAESWDKVRKVWIPETRRYCGKHVPVLLVANKAVLVGSPARDLSLSNPSFEDSDEAITSVQHSSGTPHPDSPIFRDSHSSIQDDTSEKRTSADSGIFGSTEDLVPLEPQKRPSFAHSKSRTDFTTVRTLHRGRDILPKAAEKLKLSDKTTHQCGGAAGQYGSCCSSTQQQGHSLASQIGAVGYFETSAVLNQGIDQVFQAALAAAMDSKKWRRKYRV